MAVPNSVFFAVDNPPPLETYGWQVQVRDHRRFHELIAVIDDFVSLTIGPELNASGTGSVTLDRGSPFWDKILPGITPAHGNKGPILLDYEYLFEAYENGVLRFQWLSEQVEETIVSEDGSQALVISGPGAADTLKWACIFRPGFPTAVPAPVTVDDVSHAVSASDTIPAFKWEFPPTWPIMRMWWVLFTSAQSRGTIPWVTLSFNDLYDSAGQPWDYVPTTATVSGQGYSPKLGQNLFDFLTEATGQDFSVWLAERVEWIMWPGFVLDARKTIGTHREDTVIFFEGVLQQKQRTRVRDQIANYVVVADAYGGTSIAVDPDSIDSWCRRERYEDGNENIVDPATRDALALNYLKQAATEKSQWTILVPYDQPGRRPFVDYNIGDWIGISTFEPNIESSIEAYRVLAITVQVEGLAATVELTLQSKLENFQHNLQAEMTAILNRTGTGNSIVDLSDTAVAPLPTTKSALVYNPVTKKWEAVDVNTLGGGTGATGGPKVFVQATDPGNAANPGDFWLETYS